MGKDYRYNRLVNKTRKVLVIGGGPAGVEAALAASRAGCSVVIVSEGPPGGRAVWNTLLPSKICLEAQPPVDFPSLHQRYEAVAGAWQRQIMEQLERAGVELRLGTASFLSSHEVAVTPPEGGYTDPLTADVIILATGAVPFLPPGLQPDGERIFTPNLIWQMPKLPRSIAVIGAGGPATEYVDVFSRLGIEVTWLTGPVAPLSAFPPEVGHIITGLFEQRGVKIVPRLMAREVRHASQGIEVLTNDGNHYPAETALVAIGLRPDLERLHLSATGLRIGSSGAVAVDAYGRTAIEHIYLVGDAAAPLSANISMAQGRTAGLHAAGVETAPVNVDLAVIAIYTSPQIAMVGRLSDRFVSLQKVRVPYQTCLRSYLSMDGADFAETQLTHENAFVELVFQPDGKITGALAVCPKAAEILTPLAVAIRSGLTIDELASVNPAHPTFSELAVLAARAGKVVSAQV